MGVEASGSEIENSGMETSGGEGSGIDIIIAFDQKESSGIEKEEQFSGEGTCGWGELIDQKMNIICQIHLKSRFKQNAA